MVAWLAHKWAAKSTSNLKKISLIAQTRPKNQQQIYKILLDL